MRYRHPPEFYEKRAQLELLERDLEDVGVDSLDDLDHKHPSVAAAIPILMEHRSKMTSLTAVSTVIRVLADCNVDPDLLVAEFRNTRSAIENGTDGAPSLGWTIAEALRTKAKIRHVDELLELVQDSAYGKARQMLPYALARFKKRKADILPVLINLLDDEDVMGQVLDALGKLKAVEAVPAIMPCLQHPDWGRGAQRTLTKLGVRIPEQADETAIAAYRERGLTMESTGLADLTISLDMDELLPFLFSIVGLVTEGFTATEVHNLAYFVRDMELDATDGFGFDVVYRGDRSPLYIGIFMDDIDTPDITCVTGQPLVEEIQNLIDQD